MNQFIQNFKMIETCLGIGKFTNLGRPIGHTGAHFAVLAEPPEAGVLSRYDEVVEFRNEVVEVDRALHLFEAKRGLALKRRVDDEPSGTEPAQGGLEEIRAFCCGT